MKPSGVEWIGDIPEGWEVKRLKMFSPVKRGASPRPIDDEKYYDENGSYSWVRISDVTASDIYLYEAGQKLSALGENCSIKLKSGDLFVSICASVGKPCISKINCCIHDGFVYFPKLNRTYNKFLFYIFSCGTCYGGLGKLGTQLNLNSDTIGNIYIPIPQNHEEISDFLDIETTKIDSIIQKTKTSIDKMKEYKTALISACVTGKIDVRGEDA
jgi:type I restriction enzyme S subunit